MIATTSAVHKRSAIVKAHREAVRGAPRHPQPFHQRASRLNRGVRGRRCRSTNTLMGGLPRQPEHRSPVTPVGALPPVMWCALGRRWRIRCTSNGRRSGRPPNACRRDRAAYVAGRHIGRRSRSSRMRCSGRGMGREGHRSGRRPRSISGLGVNHSSPRLFEPPGAFRMPPNSASSSRSVTCLRTLGQTSGGMVNVIAGHVVTDDRVVGALAEEARPSPKAR